MTNVIISTFQFLTSHFSAFNKIHRNCTKRVMRKATCVLWYYVLSFVSYTSLDLIFTSLSVPGVAKSRKKRFGRRKSVFLFRLVSFTCISDNILLDGLLISTNTNWHCKELRHILIYKSKTYALDVCKFII